MEREQDGKMLHFPNISSCSSGDLYWNAVHGYSNDNLYCVADADISTVASAASPDQVKSN